METVHPIPIAGPSISDREIAYVTDAVRTGWYGTAGAYVARFERAFAAHTGRSFAVSLPSCTSGLHLALASLGVGPGDEVIVPDCTWIASSAPISYVGATPVFADIDPATWCLSPASFEAAITPRTKAVIVVDLYGHMPDWDAVLAIAERHGVAVIEDAAEATGSTYKARPAGAFGCCAAFSFHGSKTMTTGEGGMLVCDDPAFHDRVQRLRDHGRAPGDVMFFNEEVGFKYKMSALQAALGLAQIERLTELVAMKRRIFGWYYAHLGGSDSLELNPNHASVENSYWMSTALLSPELGLSKEDIIPALKADGVDVRPFFYPLSSIPAYRDTEAARSARNRNQAAYAISRRGINLPSALSLTEEDVAKVSRTLLGVLTRMRPASDPYAATA